MTILALVATVPMAYSQSQTYTYTYSDVPIPVYPDSWDTAAVASILVPRSITITKVTVAVQVQFSGVGDLNVYALSPQGTRTKLLERNCGSLVNIDTTFDDAAQSPYKDFCPVEAGRGPFKANEPLTNWNGQNAYGYWKIAVENNGSDKTGYLTAFSVTIVGTPFGPPVIDPRTMVSTSSFKSGGVAPGEQLAIFGANLGAVGGTWANTSMQLPTAIGTTSVTFDNVAVPLFFAGDRAVLIHAPSTLTPGGSANVKVTSSAGTSTVVTLPIVPARPGIFTYESGGAGQARALNQDGTPNGVGVNPGTSSGAPVGTIVQLFCSGLGTVSPAINAGTPAPASPLSRVTLPVTATVGGVSATVTYAGAAPGLIGAYQVNVMIPAGTPVGPNRIVLTAGDNSSQDEVTIQVR